MVIKSYLNPAFILDDVLYKHYLREYMTIYLEEKKLSVWRA